MAVTVEQLMAAIRSVETGGQKDPYRTVNGIGAIGAYQVMYFNVAKWTREALGRTLTRDEFRNSNSAQDTVARYFLGKYMKQYGSWEEAAATWFSGSPNINSSASDGGNTVVQYIAKVRKALGGVGSGVTGASQPVSSMPSLGRSIYTAQQAGYQTEARTNAFGAPVNPYKLPGWIASQNAGAGAGGGSGVAQAGLVDDLLGGDVVPWDGVSTVVLSTLFLLGGLGLVIVGLTQALSPITSGARDTALSVIPGGAAANAAKGAAQ